MKLNNNDDSHNSGLNLLIYNMLLDIESHPAWVCGLKLPQLTLDKKFIIVTPCVGVWIETRTLPMKDYPVLVTPCVGVWIETKAILEKYKGIEVTPCVGVWIETSISRSMESISLSHPAWVCGLKRLLPTIHY